MPGSPRSGPLALRARLGDGARLYYRHRQKNHHRKAGNIADFVTRWGGHYDHMLVLDADSLMSGDCVVTLARAMEADPDSGIIQSLPLIINRNTLFARVQQFAARIYGPVIATGLALWSGRDGNYWGHNAIIRTKAFADHCGLPDLSGKPPFGGHVLSHDFVEAALIRRAGWSVYMLPNSRAPTRRARPRSSTSRSATGAGRRATSSTAASSARRGSSSPRASTSPPASPATSPRRSGRRSWSSVSRSPSRPPTSVPNTFPPSSASTRSGRASDPVRALQLFGITMAILLAPKLFGLILGLLDAQVRRGERGACARTLGADRDPALGPDRPDRHAGAIRLGDPDPAAARRRLESAARRDDGSIPLSDIVRRHRWHTILGLVAGIAAFAIATSLFLWMSPTILGLVLAIPIPGRAGSSSWGLALKRAGLLMTPEEREPPAIATAARRSRSATRRSPTTMPTGCGPSTPNPDLQAGHLAFLPRPSAGPAANLSRPRLMAQAKVVEAETIDVAARSG